MTDPRLHIRPPEWLEDVNAQVLADPQQPAAVLAVTGALRRTPVTVSERDGARYVVGGFPGPPSPRTVSRSCAKRVSFPRAADGPTA